MSSTKRTIESVHDADAPSGVSKKPAADNDEAACAARLKQLEEEKKHLAEEMEKRRAEFEKTAKTIPCDACVPRRDVPGVHHRPRSAPEEFRGAGIFPGFCRGAVSP